MILEKSDQVLMLSVGASQLIAAICEEIGFRETIDQLLDWDRVRSETSPGVRLEALVINLLMDHQPLYQMRTFFADKDLEKLFGPGVTLQQLNESAFGRALDQLHAAKAWRVYSTLALSACRRLGLPVTGVHSDTTSYSLYGSYDVAPGEEEDDPLTITYGYSKQHRPDLKQIVIGMAVTNERIPLLATVENGNTSDKRWNLTFIQKLRDQLAKEDWGKLVYQADSALITKDNLQQLGDVFFVSRLPETFGLSQTLKTKAWAADRWQSIGTLSRETKAAFYRTQAFDDVLEEVTYRFLVVHSSTLQDRKAKTFARQLDQTQEKLEAAVSRLEQTAFHCEADARKAIEDFGKQRAKSPFFQVTWSVQQEDQVEKRTRRGRPKKEEQPVTTRRYFPRHQALERVTEAIEEEKKRLSTFVLITNQMSRDALTDEDLLRTYKGQSAAETRFHLLKSPQMVDDFFLKKPGRIDALGIVVVMALLVYGILEYRVRKQMEKEKEPLHLAGNRKVFRPTGRVLLHELAQLKVLMIRQNGQVSRLLPDNIGDSVQRILKLAGYDLTLLVSNPAEALQK